MPIERLVLDTNVYVAAGFNRGSHAARLLGAVSAGALISVWDAPTRAQVLHVLGRIPPLRGWDAAALFDPAARFSGPVDRDRYGFIPDPADRAFAALAEAAGATLVSNDAHLLDHQADLRVQVLTPGAFWRRRAG